MLRQNHLFRVGVGLALACSVGASLLLAQNTSSGYQKRETSLYRDMFDQTIYYEGTQYLHLERLYSRLAGKKKRALNLNTFDEVPDSTFFTNRHGRNRMSTGELKKGPSLTSGPDPNGQWVITKGKFEGITPGFFIRDQRGDKYLLKFDPVDYIELATGAEIITSRFIHAIGYNVPQYTLVSFKKDKLDIDPNARVIDESGFRRKLTPERLEEFLLFVPETEDGSYRSSASRILTGEILGPMSLQGRRGNDPDDPVDHKDRREIRALQVFSSWLNNFDVRDSNTLDVVEEVEGRNVIRHYLLDFNSSLGGRPGGPQPPHFAHEYLFDYREIFKGLVGLGFWKRAWQKRWDEADRQITNPAVGYFDNRYFNPGGYKTQLPYFPFKDLSRADGFWAAKIIMKFTDDEIREIVSEGKYSDSKARDHIAETLIERRDLIGRYWFKQANPLDDFKLSRQGDGSYELRFEDLAVHYGFEPEGASAY
ncbi:MAG: hypothetical protein HY447_05945, partial [Candidatus Omnitrophica bacterium]|nr:hypothetical protein [Candidatus Omnitrophota bacterium]